MILRRKSERERWIKALEKVKEELRGIREEDLEAWNEIVKFILLLDKERGVKRDGIQGVGSTRKGS